MADPFKNVLIIADIEGSSGCWSYRASSFKTSEWVQACVEMTRDVAIVVKALFDNGVHTITVKDFHRTGYNLLPERIHKRARIVSGYKSGPVPGIGSPEQAEAVLFLGMHAASGTDGFLAHTLTSRISRLQLNGEPLPEVALFSASLASFGIRPIFFSGCPLACSQARDIIPGIQTYEIDKSCGPEQFEADKWRRGLALSATQSLINHHTAPYRPQGPFDAVVTLRDGESAARKIAGRWGFRREGMNIFIHRSTMSALYLDLVRICYLSPMIEKVLPLALTAFNWRGRAGMAWLRRRLKTELGPSQ
jgi:D-aminopeptidase